jgi:hypothetical protein
MEFHFDNKEKYDNQLVLDEGRYIADIHMFSHTYI